MNEPDCIKLFLFIILAVKPCIAKCIKGVLLPLLNADWPSAFVCARTLPLNPTPFFIASNQRLRTKRYTHNFSWMNTLSGDLVSTTNFDLLTLSNVYYYLWCKDHFIFYFSYFNPNLKNWTSFPFVAQKHTNELFSKLYLRCSFK